MDPNKDRLIALGLISNRQAGIEEEPDDGESEEGEEAEQAESEIEGEGGEA